jgi:thioredoxin reductase (NADPH)
MSKPVILAVDDDPQVLAAVRRDLRERYGQAYRILGAGGGPEALELVHELQLRGDTVAVFLVDQRMPELTGTAFLLRAREHFPDAKRVLLTAYADTDAAIQSINEVGLDHYLLKPWDPPEDSLYPVLDDLLDDWVAGHPDPVDGLRVVGARWDPASHDVKDFLARNQVPYRFLDLDRDPEARTLVTSAGTDLALPVVVLPSGEVLARPSPADLAAAVGLRGEAHAPFYDLLVLGAGPAGLAAAVYGASEGLRVAVLERQAVGGQAGTSSRIENYLGFPNGISGADLARRAAAQARRLGAEILLPVEVASVRVDGPTRTVALTDGRELSAHALLVASGMKVRRLEAPGCDRLEGAGVYYGATLPEAASYEGEEVVIVGGANSAGQAAMMFSRFAARVTMVVRADSLVASMSRYLIDQIERTATIEVRTGSQVARVEGEEHLEKVVVADRAGSETVLPAAGLFVFVGAVPHTDFLRGVVTLNERGFVPTGPDLTAGGSRPRGWTPDRDPFLLETDVPGIFAAGDVRHGAVRRVATAVGQGAVSISFVHRYLETV